MHNNEYNYGTLKLWEILTIRELMVISQEICTGQNIQSLRRRIGRLQATLNNIEVSINWNLTPDLLSEDEPLKEGEISAL